ncbi:MAG: LPS-assembly protein LptD [Bacteroidetes bacterium]|nr:LPS-assembly protein LptD [Bacteroidota bacterium]
MLLFSFVHAQENPLPQTEALQVIDTDTTLADTTSKKSFDIDAVVEASASDSLIFDLKSKKMFLYGNGKLKHKQTELQSGEIDLDFETNDLNAKGIVEADTLKQSPVLTEGGETYEGSSIKYNFKTQKGFISVAKNVKGEARYQGDKVKKVDRNTYFIEDGIYTTCAGDPPQTHFQASQMKVIQKDKVIAKWVFMYVVGVPIPIPLPFAVFPSESGRRSGIIIPTYGSTTTEGQYFRNFGYFFALSDYYDFKLTGDYYTKGGFGIHGSSRYKKRYSFDGSINADYSYQKRNEPGDPDRTENTQWKFSVFHRQSFNPTTSLDVNMQFQSGEYFSQNSINYNELLTQNITSNATFRKNWEESGNSMVVNYQRTQNLQSGDITEFLPNINFNKKLVYPFKQSGGSGSSKDQAWYEYFGYSYSGKFSNRRKKTDGNLNIRGGIQHDIQASASPKIGYFNISPRFSYQEKWYNKRIHKEYKTVETMTDTGIVSERKIVDTDVNELNSVRTFDFSISASTKLYGVMQPNAFGIEAFRHTLIPSVSYNINPDFTSDTWGYYDEYIDDKGNVVRYDKFGNELFGGASGSERQNISFSLGNIFEIKTIKDPTDTTSQSQKIQLLNFDLRTSYNFAADSVKFSDLSLSYRTQIGELLSFSGNSTYTFYAHNGSTAINKFLISEGRGLFRLKNLGFSISTRLSGDKLTDEKRTGKDQNKFNPDDNDIIPQNTNSAKSLYDEQDKDFSIPWNLSLDYNYNLNKTDPNKPIKSSTVGLNLGFNLTKNWKFTVRGSYDLVNDEVAAPAATVYRDLGCWEMNFTWNPLGRYRGYNFTIRLKAPELQDIKVTKSEGLYTGRR